ncbi:MAG TPA: endonuclease Q family protein, partial [Candidatus Saccharimonadales bacterium]|nr:endonuclease Q family protein [Candidatus Saccharimonadales bacterium]
MRYIADLHVHSRYAGACSPELTLENINRVAGEKGINIIGTGDFTHPDWFSEIKSKLVYENGVYKLKGAESVNFILSSEVCTIFDSGKGFKKIHNCILAPDIGAVEGINDAIGKFGSLKSDGRPLLTVRPSEFVEILHGIDKDIMVFPAHAWTPWYGVFGSYGFGSLKEAYEDQAIHIKAIETGLSSDPLMNWRVSVLDKVALVSGSDAHSLPKLGREAVVFSSEKAPSYESLIRNLAGKKLDMTVEFYPEEGKYHFDGHRKCGVSFSPEEAKKYNGICPVCRRRLTMGVLHRVEQLADREEGFKPKDAVPYVSMVPLQEIIAYVSRKAPASEYVKKVYS